ncbi:MAG: helix-turn-helix domain-containing protein [Gemmatimonadota bacterium]|nr:helix-turn-helix domain-containing protein [Gemmatimonadota bacterium]
MHGESQRSAFGKLLRKRRRQRNLTQERLAARADLSARHVSFLETGRSDPSRASVLALSRALDLTLRDRNLLLRSAGFAAVYPERDILDREGSHLRSMFSFLLARHEPFPGFVWDRAWTVRMHNDAAVKVLGWLLGDPGGTAESEERASLVGTNLLDVFFDPARLRPLVENFEAAGRFLWERLEEQIALDPASEELRALRGRIEEYGPIPPLEALPEAELRADAPALSIHLRKDGTDLRLFSFLVTVAAPQVVSLQEVRMETLLPADEESERVLRRVSDA